MDEGYKFLARKADIQYVMPISDITSAVARYKQYVSPIAAATGPVIPNQALLAMVQAILTSADGLSNMTFKIASASPTPAQNSPPSGKPYV